MDLVLSPEALGVIQERVASGEFATPEAVIDEALRLLSTRDREYGEWLRAAVAKGEESIRLHGAIPVDEAFWERIRARVRERATGP
jgi:Arc/MetJ-type ribon-helix-helix transcriptional regulator